MTPTLLLPDTRREDLLLALHLVTTGVSPAIRGVAETNRQLWAAMAVLKTLQIDINVAFEKLREPNPIAESRSLPADPARVYVPVGEGIEELQEVQEDELGGEEGQARGRGVHFGDVQTIYFSPNEKSLGEVTEEQEVGSEDTEFEIEARPWDGEESIEEVEEDYEPNDTKQFAFKCLRAGCEMTFPSISERNQHRKTTHQSLFLCESVGCGRTFIRKSLLASHLVKDHLSAMEFTCSEPGCGQVFTDRLAYCDHKKTDHQKRYMCSETVCKGVVGFKQVSSLESHMRREHGRPKLQCGHPNCGETFYSADSRSRHRKKRHDLNVHC
jgi:hypothetical protein